MHIKHDVSAPSDVTVGPQSVHAALPTALEKVLAGHAVQVAVIPLDTVAPKKPGLHVKHDSEPAVFVVDAGQVAQEDAPGAMENCEAGQGEQAALTDAPELGL